MPRIGSWVLPLLLACFVAGYTQTGQYIICSSNPRLRFTFLRCCTRLDGVCGLEIDEIWLAAAMALFIWFEADRSFRVFLQFGDTLWRLKFGFRIRFNLSSRYERRVELNGSSSRYVRHNDETSDDFWSSRAPQWPKIAVIICFIWRSWSISMKSIFSGRFRTFGRSVFGLFSDFFLRRLSGDDSRKYGSIRVFIFSWFSHFKIQTYKYICFRYKFKNQL